MEKNNDISFWSLLQIVLITLKLCGVIEWRWIFVLVPLVGGTITEIVGALILLISIIREFKE